MVKQSRLKRRSPRSWRASIRRGELRRYKGGMTLQEREEVEDMRHRRAQALRRFLSGRDQP